MKTTSVRCSLAAVVLLSTLSGQLLTAFAQGSLTPPGAPAPTMKTLTQVEPRTPISSAPFTISVPGSYYLTTNLTVTTGDAITIGASGVTLDLGGFSIFSTAPTATGSGIKLNSGVRDVTIVNGFIRGGVTYSDGVYSGPGFQYGIYYSGMGPLNTRVARVSVSGCLTYGINLGWQVVAVDSCIVRTVGSYGITASTIRNSLATDCGTIGLQGYEVSGSRGENTGDGGYGINASTAQNCRGVSVSGVGINTSVALTCYGESSSSYGVSALIAQNCHGHSYSSYGLYAANAQNCYGFCSGSSAGLRAYQVAIGCSGQSTSGTGLSAYIANSCFGSGTPGVSVTYKYNMP